MRFKKVIFIVISVCALTSLFYSCLKEDILEPNQVKLQQENSTTQLSPQAIFQKDDVDDEGKIILGNKRNNPFTIVNINQAKTILYGINAPNKMATHRYVKFMPNIQDHLAILEDWETQEEIPLFDFPLEYEILSDGESYIDPAVTDSIYTYQYASIPIETELPEVPYEVIDDLHLDTSDPLLLAESFWLTDNKDDINEYVFHGGLSKGLVESYGDDVIQALLIPEIPDEPCPPGYEWKLVIEVEPDTGERIFKWECMPVDPPPPPPTNACGCPIPANPRNPAGCVRVFDDAAFIGVEIAMVKVKDTWFSSDITYTDANGCWRVNENYSGKVWMWVKFKNQNVKARDVGFWLSLFAVRDYVGKFTSPPYNNILVSYSNSSSNNSSKARKYWAAAHTLNTVNQYRNAAAASGVPLPPTGLNWTNAAGGGGAATPMLKGQLFSSWPSFLAVFLFPVDIIYFLSLPHLPDIVNQYASGETTSNFTDAGFHELGHASHYGLVGESYWFSYRNHIINNNGYGSFGNFNPGSNPGRVALGEAIGNFTGATFGSSFSGGEFFEWINNFIPAGLMWDIVDTPIDIVTDPNNPAITGPDNISGFTPAMIFGSLTPNVNDIRDFRDRSRTLFIGSTPNTPAAYNTFVDIYDVFN
ncbi:MAG TPA: hypothetical protein ENJ28_04255 [Gammaproteobacteria bacterium]|nr:hypothetical protein [Gammaproteobacteria bacterium]